MKQPQLYTTLLTYELVPAAFMPLLQLTFKDYRGNKRIIGRYKLQEQFVPLSVFYTQKHISLWSKSRRSCIMPCAEP